MIDHAFNLVMQESIAKQINENPEAGWEAAMNPRFSNYTVSLELVLHPFKVWISLFYFQMISYIMSVDLQVEQFKRLLGAKQTPKAVLGSVPVISHPKSLKLPVNFDARTAWSQCGTIGRILGRHLLSPFPLFYLF